MIAPVRILVVTVVHHPEDSRIRHRQIKALLAAGWQVTYAAPFTGYGLSTSGAPEGLSLVDLPRAAGRRRFRAWRAARDLLKRRGPQHDVILLHDPELLAALPRQGIPPVVWDVHEDTAAALTLKPWLPPLMRPGVRWLVERMERWAERRVHLILAEYAYRNRFRDEHLVVPNVNAVPESVPPPDLPRAVYVGSLTPARGALDMIEVARLVAGKTQGAVKVLLIGPAASDVTGQLRAAVSEGVLDWPGFLPSHQAMQHVDGSLAGLSLLHDEPNYRVSLPTKVVEYMAHGIPVVTTPLPLAQELVAESGCGVVVPFGDSEAVARAILDLWSDPERRRQMGTAGHLAARERYDWATHGADFVAELHRLIQRSRR
jgi:glycosyltransferase involved in cell wall biosynthesis